MRRAALAVGIGLALLTSPGRAEAQAVAGLYGVITGTAGGVYTSTAIFVAKARTGSYVYSIEDALTPRWELIPVAGMAIGGGVIGLTDEQRLANGVKWGAAGFAAGAIVGLAAGTLFASDEHRSEDQWAGAIIGSAAGMLAGSIYGALAYDSDPDGGAIPLVSIRLSL